MPTGSNDLVEKDGWFYYSCPVCNGEIKSDHRTATILYAFKHFRRSHPDVKFPDKIGDVTITGDLG